MTREELIKKYKSRIHIANDKNQETSKIIIEIGTLVYQQSKLPLSNKDKVGILTDLKHGLLHESVILHAQDNKDFLVLIDQAIIALGGK